MPLNNEILSNPHADRVRKIAGLESKSQRERSGRFLIEGPQSVREAIRWRPDAVTDLYVQMSGDDPQPANQTIAEIYREALDNPRAGQQGGLYIHGATAQVMRQISGDCQGIAAIGLTERMQDDPEDLDWSDHPMVAAFWQVRDPGNAGTVIRAADAAGCDAVIFVDDSVDRFNPKVVRATAGSLFHVPVLTMTTEVFLAWCAEQHSTLVAADVHGTPSRPPEQLPSLLGERGHMLEHSLQDSARLLTVLFGNEARGLPTGLVERADRVVAIPIYGKAESLNLATSAAVMLMSLAMSSHIGKM
ncbi:TrmH family RNA methyltransferase [Bifidobacterium boum]|uniref:rRNA methylase n=1 Tax=Bifidobacterium boum TaxID=78343 RepID=A0A086ZFH1_9BIFI|nr:RNA methyltransferase [Bifidobacterium boum]KFI45271.1 rRNA methylase [Bifidobacterium boum]